MTNEITLTEESFEREVLGSNGLVMVNFRAEWCGSCHIMSPVIKEMAEEFKGKLKVASLDVDENATVSAHYGIRSVPSLLFFRGGELVGQIIGAVSRKELADRVGELLQDR